MFTNIRCPPNTNRKLISESYFMIVECSRLFNLMILSRPELLPGSSCKRAKSVADPFMRTAF
jgi:hypothetical protein